MQRFILIIFYVLFAAAVHGQKIIGPKMAQKFDIRLIMYGENQAEYGNGKIDDHWSKILKVQELESKIEKIE